MFKFNYFKNLLILSLTLSSISCTFIQKTKHLFKRSKYLPLYSLIVNLIISIIFCLSFTNIKFPSSLWVGLFSFLGADSIYKKLEGKIPSHKDIVKKDSN